MVEGRKIKPPPCTSPPIGYNSFRQILSRYTGFKMSEYQTEFVLVVPTRLFHRLGRFQGFNGDVQRYLDELLLPENTLFKLRAEVETDPSFKQLIPYMIFRYIDPQGRQTVFQYTRGTGQGEERLHRKRSVGIGGHISTIDLNADQGSSPYEEGLRRELDEEVFIEAPYSARCVGMINDDQTEVGSVHLGVVYLFDLKRPAVRPRESEITQCSFRPVEKILAELAGFETWSQICMEALFGDGRRPD